MLIYKTAIAVFLFKSIVGCMYKKFLVSVLLTILVAAGCATDSSSSETSSTSSDASTSSSPAPTSTSSDGSSSTSSSTSSTLPVSATGWTQARQDADVLPLPNVASGATFRYENVSSAWSGVRNVQIDPEGQVVFLADYTDPQQSLITLDVNGSFSSVSLNVNAVLLSGFSNTAFRQYPLGDSGHETQMIEITSNNEPPSNAGGLIANGLYDNSINSVLFNGDEIDILLVPACEDCVEVVASLVSVDSSANMRTVAHMPEGFIPDGPFSATDDNNIWITAGRVGGAPAAGGDPTLVIGHGANVTMVDPGLPSGEYPSSLSSDGSSIFGIFFDGMAETWAGVSYVDDSPEVFEFNGLTREFDVDGSPMPYFNATYSMGLFYTANMWVMPIAFTHPDHYGPDRIEYWVSDNMVDWVLADTTLYDPTGANIQIAISGGRVLTFVTRGFAPGGALSGVTDLFVEDLFD